MKPTIGYDGDAGNIKELGAGLGVELFPVGYEASEFGILLVDGRGRLFHLHHTGATTWEPTHLMRFLGSSKGFRISTRRISMSSEFS